MTVLYNLEFLREYEFNERQKVKREISALDTTHVTSVKDIYPDVEIGESSIYLRGDVPLKLLLLLYDTIILYLPPASKEYFQSRFDISYDDILTLCRKEVIKPLIAHPPDYTAPYFKELLDLNPPSVWSRGISLVESFNMDFDEAQRKLPLKRIAGFASVRKQWRRHYPQVNEDELTENIVRELSTLYADLVVFGYHDTIDNLLAVGIPDFQMVYYLKTLNELLTYPILFGLGGVPVFDSNNVKGKFSMNISLESQMGTPDVICPSLIYILEKMDIYFRDVSIERIMDFRLDGYVGKLQEAIKDIQLSANRMCRLGKVNTETIRSHASKLDAAMEDFNKQLDTDIPRSLKKIEQSIRGGVNLGGLSLGNFLIETTNGETIDLTRLCGYGNFSSIDFLPQDIKRLITSEIISRKFSPTIATLWEVRNKLHG